MKDKRRSGIRLFIAAFFIQMGLGILHLSQRFSSFLGTMVLILSKPDDLEKLIQRFYRRPSSVELWGGTPIRSRGLFEEESRFVTTYLHGKKKCLVLMCGGGRESLALAKLGFEVMGIDSSEALIQKAREHASFLSLACTFEVGDVLNGIFPSEKYDALFLTQTMYSTIPTRRRRTQFLKKVRQSLKEDGLFYLEFCKRHSAQSRFWKYRIKKILSALFCGNRELEEGDSYWIGGTFTHHFNHPAELLSETEESGFKMIELDFDKAYVVISP